LRLFRVKLIGILWLVLTAALLLVIFTAQSWLIKIAEFLIVENRLEPCDLVVALAYSRDMRIRHAAKLYHQGYGSKVVLDFGGGPRSELPNIYRVCEDPLQTAKDFAVSQGVPDQNILIQNGATSTYDEALYLKKLIRQNQYRSVIIVTSALHTRRVAMIFKKVLNDTPVKLLFYAVPVEDEAMSLVKWWTREDELIYINNEYIKLVFYYFKYII